MTNQSPNNKSKYDLSERTALLGESIIYLVKKIKEDVVNRSLFSQIVRSSTSIGANYMEADGAQSKKDFQHKISLCRKEAKETMHWLRMLAVANTVHKEQCRKLWKEAHELVLIFSTILKK
jgi:four helix bundle protein